MGTKDFPLNGRCPCGSRVPSDMCHRLGPEEAAALETATAHALRESGADPAIVYAYERTHLIITSEFRKKHMLDAAADLDDWDDAIMEYRESHGCPTHWVDLLRFDPLVARLREIDAKLDVLAFDISASPDPDSAGLLDALEDLAGDGFVACQLYLIERMGEKRRTRPNPLRCGPKVNARFVAEVINVAGNYRKHFGEWPSDPARYEDQQKFAIAVFNEAGVTHADYRLSNLLLNLSSPDVARFATLVPKLIEWREAVDQLPIASNEVADEVNSRLPEP